MDGPDVEKPINPRPPTPRQFEERVKFLAQYTERVNWSLHAFDRIDDRGITTTDALRILRSGFLDGPIDPGRRQGEWQGTIVYPLKGRREAGVVTILLSDSRLFVKTVMWMDPH